MENPFSPIVDRLTTIEKYLVKFDNRFTEPQTTSTTEAQDRYITTKEVADIYGVSEVSIWDWEQKNYITGYRIGQTKRFKLSEIMTAPKLIIRKKK